MFVHYKLKKTYRGMGDG